jgi:paraquat-inducible protein B
VSKRVNPTLIGAFVVGGIALVIAAFMLLGDVGLFKEREKVIMYFTGSVEGLNKGAPVNVRGVKVGTVIDIDVEMHPLDGEFYIPVIVQFEPDAVKDVRTIELAGPDQDHLKYLIEEYGLRAQLKLQSILTSQMAIELDYHPDTQIHYHGDGELPEIPTIPMAFEQLGRKLQNVPVEQMLNDLTSILTSLDRIISSPDAIELMSTLNKTMKTIDQLARNIDNNLQPLADNTNDTLRSINSLTQNLNSNLQPLADNTQSALLDAQKALRKLEALLNEDSTQLYNLNIALEEIVRAARSIRQFAETIERQPETLLRGKNPQD